MSVIGIDLGNTDCVLAQAKRGGIDVLLNENSNRKNPNMISFNGKHRLMGESAAAVARTNFRNTVTSVKLLIGRLFQDPFVQEEITTLPFTCVELPNGYVGIEVQYNDQKTVFSCEQLLAMILTKLDSIATSQNEGIKSSYCVLSVPGYFTDLQRRGVLNSCQIANISCLRILNEHTAVALGYGIYKSARNLFDSEKPTNVMFLDIGNTAYTVSIVAFVQGKLQVKSVAYDIRLGGRDFDMAIAKYIAGKFSEKYKGLNPLLDAKARMKLLTACEKTKKNLSPQGVTIAPINIECLMDEKDYNGKLELEEFETIIAPLLERLESPISQALADAKLEKSDLTDVEIVGGGTRISSLKKRLADILGLDKNKPNMGLSTTLNADEAVARGCALQCAILSPLFKVKEFDVRDINSFPVEVSWEKEQGCGAQAANEIDDDCDAVMSGSDSKSTSLVIMTRKDDFPKTKKINFKRFDDFKIHANYATEDSPYLSSQTPRKIGEFQVAGITSLRQQEKKSIDADNEGARVTIYMRQDLNGLFYVSSGHIMQEIIEEETQPTAEQTESKPAAAPEKEKKEQENDSDMKDVEETKETKPAAEEPKKKRFRRIDLNIVSSVNGLSQTEIQQAIETEVAMANQDRVIEETSNKRNELESYIYEMRDLVNSKYRDVITESDRKAFEAILEETENWLYDEGFDCMKSVYQEKLDALLKYGDPLNYRLSESQDRPSVIARFNQTIEEILRQANSQEPATEHWTSADRDVLRKACQQKQQWLYQQIEVQSKCPMTENPKLTCQLLQDEMNNLTKECGSVLNKPKPKPEIKKEEPKPEEPKTAEEEAKKEEPVENSSEKMELD